MKPVMSDPKNEPLNDSPTVLVIDDDPEVRKSIEQLLATVDLSVQTFESAEEFLETGPHDKHGCILLDQQMPGMTGIQLLRVLVQDDCRMPIIMVTAHAEVPIAVEALKLGAFDFVEKPYRVPRMLEKVQMAIAQDLGQRQAMSLRAKRIRQLSELSAREREVVDLLSSGRATKEIADALDISASTVDFHRTNVLRKMELESVVDLVRIVAGSTDV
jgi:FixJ family two-component response regulator